MHFEAASMNQKARWEAVDVASSALNKNISSRNRSSLAHADHADHPARWVGVELVQLLKVSTSLTTGKHVGGRNPSFAPMIYNVSFRWICAIFLRTAVSAAKKPPPARAQRLNALNTSRSKSPAFQELKMQSLSYKCNRHITCTQITVSKLPR